MELGAGAGVTPPRARAHPEHQTRMIKTERLVQRARAAPMLSLCAGAPGSAATSRGAILCIFHVFLIQSFRALIRSLCSLSFPGSQWPWQHPEECVGCVSYTALTHTGERLPWLPFTRTHRAGERLGTRASFGASQPNNGRADLPAVESPLQGMKRGLV